MRLFIGEAYSFALVSVRRWYKERNRPLTEHCQIEDDGDGRSGHGLLPTSRHGQIALRRFLSPPGELATGGEE